MKTMVLFVTGTVVRLELKLIFKLLPSVLTGRETVVPDVCLRDVDFFVRVVPARR